MATRGFVVDTHLLRELGDLLVGRDSTAVLELVKNGYDADATVVRIDATSLNDPDSASLQVTDDGNGMSLSRFESAFLRIAGRSKEEGARLSPLFKRAYTGQKGIGRLASQKLARRLEIFSIPSHETVEPGGRAVVAKIDWDEIDRQDRLDNLESGLDVDSYPLSEGGSSGTLLSLKSLKRKWTPFEIAKFTSEIRSAQAPSYITDPDALAIGLAGKRLFEVPEVRNISESDPGFRLELGGDLAVGDDLWETAARDFTWCIEIDVEDGVARFKITPTMRQKKTEPLSTEYSFRAAAPSALRFQSRFYVLPKASTQRGPLKSFVRNDSGIRVYFEGFRVLPYGEVGNDWLGIDRDYRTGPRFYSVDLDDEKSDDIEVDTKEALSALGNASYFGAVFLTDAGTEGLQALVNREGFVPGPVYDSIRQIVGDGVKLSVRARRSVHNQRRLLDSRDKPRTDNSHALGEDVAETTASRDPENHALSAKVPYNVLSARRNTEEVLAKIEEARTVVSHLAPDGSNQLPDSGSDLQVLADGFVAAREMLSGLESVQPELRTLAGVGLQLGAFVHDVNGMLASVSVVRELLASSIDATGDRRQRERLKVALRSAEELAHTLARQSSYLTDVLSNDPRRRRSKVIVRDRVDAVARFIAGSLEKRSVNLEIFVPLGLKGPPMFPSEITILLTNLLTNAVKNAGVGGTVWIDAVETHDYELVIHVTNSGVAVDLEDSERWFLPFESTTVTVDEVLGQGLGLGLPIVRAIADDYRGAAAFVEPLHGGATSIRVELGKRGTSGER